MRATLILASLLCASTSNAERLTGLVTDVTPILKESQDGRILLRLGLPELSPDVAIRRVILIFDVPATEEAQRLPLRIYPVTTAWDPATVDWETGWTRPGGDYPDDLFARGEIDLGREGGAVAIDLTALVKEIVEDGYFADGLLMTLDPNEGETIRASDLARFVGLASGRLELSSRTVPQVPREVTEVRDPVR